EFKPDGVKIEQNYFTLAGPAINEALANNSVDIASYGDLPAIIGKAAGLPTLVIAGQRGLNTYVAVPAKSTAKSIADLKGKRVGVAKGTYMHLSFDRVIDSLGLTEKDFDLINIQTANGENAVAAGDLDAYVEGNGALRLQDLGLAKIIYDNRKDPDDWKGQTVLVVRESFYKKYPETTKRFLKVWLKALQWENDPANRKESFELDANTGTPLAYLAEDKKDTPLSKVYNPLFDDDFINHYKYAVKFSKEHKLIKNEFDVDAWLNKNLLAEGLKEVNWQ
ncbi:MAG TPA: ABC transporter substrate-binding protein, partial [Verrucomicrobiae bacterium]